jgi:serine protease Do
MAETISRDNCPRCKKPVDPAARRCPDCRGSLLVDVIVDSAPPGERARYNLAKALSQLDPPSPTFSAAQQAVNIPHSVLMDGVTRETARRLLHTLKEYGSRASMPPHVEVETVEEPGSLTNFFVVILLVGAIAFALYAYTWRLRNPAGETVKPAGARVERAARAATVARVAPLDLAAISKKALPALVELRCRASRASGFLVAPDMVLTSIAALCPAGEPVRAMLADGREVRGAADRRDERFGLALVRIPASGVEPLPFGDASTLRTGDRVVLFSGSEARQGTVGDTVRSVLGTGYFLVEPAPEPPGSPILNVLGRVVGVVTSPPDIAGHPGFVAPINYVYTGDRRLIDPPARLRPDVEGWNEYLVRALDADREEVQLYISDIPQPALLSARTVSGRGVIGTFLMHDVEQPKPRVLQLTVRTDEKDLCHVNAYVLDWTKVDTATPGAPAAGSLYFQWLRANNLLQDAYQGFATLDLGTCPQQSLRGALIVLDGGDERADRIRL